MKSFKSTYLFLSLVLVLGAYAYHDYQSNQKNIEQKQISKQLFVKFKLEDVKSFKIEGPQNFAIEKSDGHWHLTEPIKDLADENEVKSFLRQIITHKVARISADEFDSLEDYGFAKPLAKLSIEANDHYELLIGSKRSFDQGYYLKKSNSEDLFVGTSSLTALINKLYSDFRSLHAYNLSSDVTAFEVKGPNQLSFKMVDDIWELEGDKEFPLSQQSVSDYLSQILNLEGTTVVDAKAPSRKPDYFIKVMHDSGDIWQARVWANSDDGADLIVNDENKVYKISKEAYSFLDRKKNELKAKAEKSEDASGQTALEQVLPDNKDEAENDKN